MLTVHNGIRLTGMSAYGRTLTGTEQSQVSNSSRTRPLPPDGATVLACPAGDLETGLHPVRGTGCAPSPIAPDDAHWRIPSSTTDPRPA
jgi:hypothetical protein